MEGFAKLAAPLHKLVAEHTGPKGRPLRKGQADRNFGMSWTEACQASFKALKGKLVASPVFAYADFSLPWAQFFPKNKEVGCGQLPMQAAVFGPLSAI